MQHVCLLPNTRGTTQHACSWISNVRRSTPAHGSMILETYKRCEENAHCLTHDVLRQSRDFANQSY